MCTYKWQLFTFIISFCYHNISGVYGCDSQMAGQGKLTEAKGNDSLEKYSDISWSLYKPVSQDSPQFWH